MQDRVSADVDSIDCRFHRSLTSVCFLLCLRGSYPRIKRDRARQLPGLVSTCEGIAAGSVALHLLQKTGGYTAETIVARHELPETQEYLPHSALLTGLLTHLVVGRSDVKCHVDRQESTVALSPFTA